MRGETEVGCLADEINTCGVAIFLTEGTYSGYNRADHEAKTVAHLAGAAPRGPSPGGASRTTATTAAGRQGAAPAGRRRRAWRR